MEMQKVEVSLNSLPEDRDILTVPNGVLCIFVSSPLGVVPQKRAGTLVMRAGANVVFPQYPHDIFPNIDEGEIRVRLLSPGESVTFSGV